MSSDVISALIGVISGVASAFLTAHMTTVSMRRREKREDARQSTYLTSLIAPTLRDYAAKCLEVSYDDGCSEGRPAGDNGYAQAITVPPTFSPLEFAVEWKSLPSDVMTDVLTFPEHANALARVLDDDGYFDPPDFIEYFEVRQMTFLNLGLKALSLAERLHVEVELNAHDLGAEQRRRMVERRGDLETRRLQREARIAQRLGSLSPPRSA